jgi:hypothetical protein
MCTITGYHKIETVVRGGSPGQLHVRYTYSWLHINYIGGVKISEFSANPLGSETLHPGRTPLPNDLFVSTLFFCLENLHSSSQIWRFCRNLD